MHQSLYDLPIVCLWKMNVIIIIIIIIPFIYFFIYYNLWAIFPSITKKKLWQRQNYFIHFRLHHVAIHVYPTLLQSHELVNRLFRTKLRSWRAETGRKARNFVSANSCNLSFGGDPQKVYFVGYCTSKNEYKTMSGITFQIHL
jgi:hypothetical protein